MTLVDVPALLYEGLGPERVSYGDVAGVRVLTGHARFYTPRPLFVNVIGDAEGEDPRMVCPMSHPRVRVRVDEVVDVVARPTEAAFRPRRIVVHGGGSGWRLEQIRVGGVPLMLAPPILMSELEGPDDELDLGVVQIGMDLLLRVRNLGGGDKYTAIALRFDEGRYIALREGEVVELKYFPLELTEVSPPRLVSLLPTVTGTELRGVCEVSGATWLIAGSGLPCPFFDLNAAPERT